MRVTTRSQPIVITVDPYASLTLSSPPLSSRTPLCPRPHSRHLPQQPPPPQQQQHHTTLLLLLLLLHHHHLSTLPFPLCCRNSPLSDPTIASCHDQSSTTSSPTQAPSSLISPSNYSHKRQTPSHYSHKTQQHTNPSITDRSI
ncbi:hypothetical protein AAZX31_16G087200 [Glycine max]